MEKISIRVACYDCGKDFSDASRRRGRDGNEDTWVNPMNTELK